MARGPVKNPKDCHERALGLLAVRPRSRQELDRRLSAAGFDAQEVSDVLGRLEGRSSLGRIGIIVHGTAGLFDPGWSGKATLELSNLGRMPVALYPGMRICSFTFEQLSTKVAVPYRLKPGNKYSGQTKPLASKLVGEVSKETA